MRRTNFSYILTIIITSLFAFALGLKLEIFPFGSYSIITEQDGVLFVGFYKYLISTFFANNFTNNLANNDIFYSWGNTLGGNALGLLSYHSFSIFNFLLAFFSNIFHGIHVIFFIKLNLIALSFCALLNYIYKNHTTAKALASFSYAFMGYNMFFIQWNLTTYQDALIFLPLVYLGIKKIVDKKQAFLYISSLSLLIISNYYMGYMVCVASILFFMFATKVHYSKYHLNIYIERFLLYTFSTILSLGISSVILLPSYLSIPIRRKNSIIDIIKNVHLNDISLDLFKGFFSLTPSSFLISCNEPIIFIGIIPTIFLIIYFFNKKINIEIRHTALLIILLFLLSFYISSLNAFWHGMSYNNWFNYRYSFIFSFFTLLISFDSYVYLKKANLKALKSQVVNTMLVCVLFYNLFSSHLAFLRPIVNENHIDKYQMKMHEYAEDIKTINDKSFYRLDKTYYYTYVDAMLLNYNGATNFASTENLNLQDFINTLGIPHKYFATSYDSDVPLSLDTLFGFKYILSKEKLAKELKLLNISENKTYIYKNENTFPIIFRTESLLPSVKDCEDSFECLNKIFRSIISDIQDIYSKVLTRKITRKDNEILIDLNIKSELPLYIYFPYELKNIKVLSNNLLIIDKQYGKTRYKPVYALGKFKNGDNIQIQISPNQNLESNELDDVALYYEDSNNILRYKNRIKLQDTNIQKLTSSYLQFKTKNQSDVIFASSIPYDKGWQVFINGSPTNIIRNFEQFIAFKVPKGAHQIDLIYRPIGFKLGLIISLISLVIYIMLIIKEFKKTKQT
ncbi:MAG: YfhO family protein [Bdellovibrionota bacterium]